MTVFNKKIGRVFGIFFVIFLVLIAIIIFSSSGLSGNIKIFTVQSGSMAPTLKTGSLIFVKSKNQYEKNDIVTFYKKNLNTTHRIVKIIKNKNNVLYITKGDANQTPDFDKLRDSQIQGALFFSIPLVGYLIGFVKTQVGLSLIIVIPSTIIVWTEIMNVKKEVVKLLKKKNENKI